MGDEETDGLIDGERETVLETLRLGLLVAVVDRESVLVDRGELLVHALADGLFDTDGEVVEEADADEHMEAERDTVFDTVSLGLLVVVVDLESVLVELPE